VTGAPGDTDVTLDARTATTDLSLTLPQASTLTFFGATLTRQSTDGSTFSNSVGLLGGPMVPLYFNPQPPPKVGKLDETAQYDGVGPATGVPYRYDVGFDSDQIPVDQTYNLTRAQLATVHEDFAGDPANGTNLPYFQAGLTGSGIGVGTVLPALGPLTEYTNSPTGEQWNFGLQGPVVFTQTSVSFGLTLSADPVTYNAGQTYARIWAKGPLAPNFGQHAASPQIISGCQACTGGGNLYLGFDTSGDSNPDSIGYDTGTVNLTLYENGRQLVSGPYTGGTVTGIPSAPTTYRAVFDNDLSTTGLSQSTKTHTDETFQYSPTVDPGSTLPSQVACYAISFGSAGSCQVLPLLSVDYNLLLDDTNTSHLPLQAATLDISHLSYGGQGSKALVTSATLAVSFDNGTTWQNVPLIGLLGHYAALWPNPASKTAVSPMLRVTATDSAGGSITQTVTNAYTIAPR
jgi:hypothetical protein